METSCCIRISFPNLCDTFHTAIGSVSIYNTSLIRSFCPDQLIAIITKTTCLSIRVGNVSQMTGGIIRKGSISLICRNADKLCQIAVVIKYNSRTCRIFCILNIISGTVWPILALHCISICILDLTQIAILTKNVLYLILILHNAIGIILTAGSLCNYKTKSVLILELIGIGCILIEVMICSICIG